MSTRYLIEKRFKDTITVGIGKTFSGSGSTYASTVTINKCRIEDGFFETINNKGIEIKSKTHIITYETYIPENSAILSINGVSLGDKPLIVKADRKTPEIGYENYLYECWV